MVTDLYFFREHERRRVKSSLDSWRRRTCEDSSGREDIQCDQMARLIFQNLAICSHQNLPKINIKIG